MPYGSILAKFKKITIDTADDKHYDLEMNWINKWGVRIIGIPHLGFRHRARLIFSMIDSLSLPAGRKVLDAGCGYGVYSFMMAERKHHITCIDISAERIRAVKQRISEYPPFASAISAERGTLTDLPYKDHQFDLIICSEVLEHMEEDVKAVSELVRVLAPGGYLVLTTPTDSERNQRVYPLFDHVRPGYSDQEYRDIAEKFGMEILQMKYFEYKIGIFLFHLIQAIDNKILLALIFYPIYLVSHLDRILKIGEPTGVVSMMKKLE